MKNIAITISVLLFFVLPDLGYSQSNQTTVTINTTDVINNSYIGNGAEWDPYQLNYGKVKFKPSDINWQKLYGRLNFMRPQFIRVMINTTSLIKNGKLDVAYNHLQMSKILGYCQKHGVTVVFGDWGDHMVSSKTNEINRANLSYAARYVKYLINDKGYTCIKYYNMVNEPNGYWSAADGNYQLWSRAISYFHKELVKENINNKISIIGPDIAIWTKKETWWVDSTRTHLGNAIHLYDIHTYPSISTINSRKYSQIINAYKKQVPLNSKIVISELGIKFIAAQDSVLKRENYQRAKAKPYASTEDSQMFVYNYSYGIDVGDALFQIVNDGFSGVNVWMLDDALHSKGPKYKLKVWGFWNILGNKFFGAKEEKVRPWYYAWSLLTKYMPTGSKIFKVNISGSRVVNAIAAEKNDKYMLALINISNTNKMVKIQSSTLPTLSSVKEFIYSKGTLNIKDDHTILPNKFINKMDLQKSLIINMPSRSIIVYTNYEY